MAKTQLENVSILAIYLSMGGCAAAPPSSGNNYHSGAGGSGSNGGADDGVGGNFVPVGTGGAPLIDPDSGRPMRCNDAGKCTCINIAEFGKTGKFGAVQNQDSSTAFREWMNSKSSANVDVYSQRTTITPDLLAKYDVIVLQSLSEDPNGTQPSSFWTYSPDEISAVSDWVQTKGGAVIALTGYFSDNSYEIAPTNQLIQFSGLTFSGDDIIKDADCPIDPATNQMMCWCDGQADPISAWSSSSQISQSISKVGAYRGRSINAPTEDIVATFTSVDGSVHTVAAAAQVGKGRVFVFGDEWVTYNSQWNGTGLQPDIQANSFCQGYWPQDLFQVPQFWFNVIKWCQPLAECFTINEPTIKPVIIN